MILALVTSIAIARVYGVEVLGAYALALAPAGLLNQVASMREQTALMRDLATLEPREPRVTGLSVAVFAFSTALAAAIGLVTAVVTYFILVGPVDQPDLVWPTLALLANHIVLANMGWNLDAVLLGFRAGRQLYRIRLFQSGSYLVIALVAVFVTESVWALVGATIASTWLSLLVRLPSVNAFMRFHVPRAELREGFRALPEMIRYGMKFVPGEIAAGVTNESGTWIIGITSPLAAVGAWSRASMLARRLTEPSIRLAEVLFPTLIERRAKGDAEGFDLAAVDSVRYSAAGMLLMAAAGGGAALGVMNVFGPGFDQAADALALLLLLPFAQCVANAETTLISAVDRPLLAAMLTVGRTVVVLALAIPLGVAFDLTGVAAGYAIGFLLDVALRSVIAARHLHQPLHTLWSRREMATVVAAYALGFVAARLVDDALGGHLGTLVALTAGVLAFAAAFVVAGGVNHRDRARLQELLARRRARARGRALAG